MQRAVHNAVRAARLAKRATCDACRHTFVTVVLEAGTHIRTLPTLRGHKNVLTMVIYTHIVDRGVIRPLDRRPPPQRGAP
ncbi:tyrosine-type recombinase/integrase [Sorangium sp. So ce269]